MEPDTTQNCADFWRIVGEPWRQFALSSKKCYDKGLTSLAEEAFRESRKFRTMQ